MSDEAIQETMRSNGEVVFGALKSINGPATIQNVVDFLAAANELNPSKIRKPVKEILTTGYNLGFLNKKGARYILEPNDVGVGRQRSRSRQSTSRAKQSRSRSKKRS